MDLLWHRPRMALGPLCEQAPTRSLVADGRLLFRASVTPHPLRSPAGERGGRVETHAAAGAARSDAVRSRAVGGVQPPAGNTGVRRPRRPSIAPNLPSSSKGGPWRWRRVGATLCIAPRKNDTSDPPVCFRQLSTSTVTGALAPSASDADMFRRAIMRATNLSMPLCPPARTVFLLRSDDEPRRYAERAEPRAHGVSARVTRLPGRWLGRPAKQAPHPQLP